MIESVEQFEKRVEETYTKYDGHARVRRESDGSLTVVTLYQDDGDVTIYKVPSLEAFNQAVKEYVRDYGKYNPDEDDKFREPLESFRDFSITMWG
jgi:hypothetical protein